jgi:hypothetical protein
MSPVNSTPSLNSVSPSNGETKITISTSSKTKKIALFIFVIISIAALIAAPVISFYTGNPALGSAFIAATLVSVYKKVLNQILKLA